MVKRSTIVAFFFNFCFISIVFGREKLKKDNTNRGDCDGLKAPCYINDRDNLKFFILADFGGKDEYPYVTDKQKRVAQGLSNVDQIHNCKFFLTAGDNFYHSGVTNDSDVRFQETFEKVYSDSAHQKPWYLIAGNHDYLGNVSAEMAYTDKSLRWNFPFHYYKFSYNVRDKFTVEFLMIDTVILCGNIFDSQDLVPPGPTDYLGAEREWSWIESSLKESKADYLFIVGHYPVRSKGRQGKTTGCVQARMEMLMKKYDVSAYISGHDHNLQHFQYKGNDGHTLNYIVSGMSAVHDDVQIDLKEDNERSLFFFPEKGNDKDAAKGGFVVCNLNRKRGNFMFFNGDGEKMYSFSISSRNLFKRAKKSLN